MPTNVAPMLAVLAADVPSDPHNYAFEYKWDGVRAIGYYDGKRLELRSRNDLIITQRYPELHSLGEAIGKTPVVLDGEIIALDEHERPSFTRLQKRMHVNDRHAIARLMHEVPAFFVLFDLLYIDGKNTMSLPYTERRKLLEELAVSGPYWQRTPMQVGDGAPMLETARQNGMEGIVAKKLNSSYDPGRRSDCWLKVKIIQRQELVIGGWIPEQGGRMNHVGALLTGYYDRDGKLHYAGSVGTGFNAKTHAQLTSLFAKHQRSTQPFAEKLPKKGMLWLDPVLVAEIEYRRWPAGGLMQQGAFKGLRSDKSPREVVRELPTEK